MSIIVVLLFVLGSIGAVGTQNEIKNDCGCEVTANNEEVVKNGYYLGNLLDGKPLPPGKEFTGFVPNTWDWRDAVYNGITGDWTTGIKAQGYCGSCYAFAALGAMESCIKIKSENPDLSIDLSEQFMISCGQEWVSGIFGCDGAYSAPPFQFLEQYGAITESCFPYTSGQSGYVPDCDNKCEDWEDQVIGIIDWGTVANNENSIQNALLEYGPLSVSMEVYEDFVSYSGGIYEYSWGSYDGSHRVVIVGYNNNQNYWICKNSWGKYWGENGWFRIAYDEVEIGDSTIYLECTGWGDKSKFLNGDEFDEITGEWEEWSDEYGDNAIHMSEGGEECKATYIFDLESNTVFEGMQIGINYYDKGLYLFSNGPDLRVWNWDSASWTTWEDVGKHGEPPQWKWKTTSGSNKYVNNNGEVKVMVVSRADDFWIQEGDETFLYKIGVRYSVPLPPPEPNLDCEGSISGGEVEPGDPISGTFTVENIGDEGSKLDWEVVDWPTWGSSWDISPSSGNDLEKGDVVTITVDFNAPNEPGFKSGKIKVVNKEKPSDYDEVTVSVNVKKSRSRFLVLDILELLKVRFPFLFNFINNLQTI